jgi:hypothetical protein
LLYEITGDIETARAILSGLQDAYAPCLLEAAVRFANFEHRVGNREAALAVLRGAFSKCHASGDVHSALWLAQQIAVLEFRRLEPSAFKPAAVSSLEGGGNVGGTATTQAANGKAAEVATSEVAAATVAEVMPASPHRGVSQEFEELLASHSHDRSIWEAAVSAAELQLANDARAATVLSLSKRALDAKLPTHAVDGQPDASCEAAPALSLDDRQALAASALTAMDSYGHVRQMWNVVELQTGLLREVLQANAQNRKRPMDAAAYGQQHGKHQVMQHYAFHPTPADPQAAVMPHYYHQPHGYDYGAYYQQHGYYGYG